MPNIKPISDLRNYGKVLRDVSIGQPVFLTKNGRGRYAILDIDEYERLRASVRLMTDLAQGEQAARDKGWMTLEDLRARLGV